MEKEISNGAMLGIVLIALAAIIGLGFGVFAIAKGTANEGVTNVQESLGAVGNSAFTDFDQKIVTGTQVVSAYQSFEGKPYAILIATQAIKDNTTASGTLSDKGAGLTQAYGSVASKFPTVAAKETTEESATGMKVKNSKGTDIELTFINYNAKLHGVGDATGKIGFDSSCWRTTEGYATSNGKVLMNGVTGNMSKSGMAEYIPSGARFQAYLIKDLSGTIMGMAFEQLNSN